MQKVAKILLKSGNLVAIHGELFPLSKSDNWGKHGFFLLCKYQHWYFCTYKNLEVLYVQKMCWISKPGIQNTLKIHKSNC